MERAKHRSEGLGQMREPMHGFKAGVALRPEYFFGIIFQQHDKSFFRIILTD
jgi:hypothetical protein